MSSAEGGGDDRRVPRDWPGLFRFCQEATAAEDPTTESRFVEMDPEKECEGPGAAGGHQGPELDPETARVNQDRALAALSLYRYRIPGDGNCLYRAVAWQLKFDQDKYHPLLRRVSVKWMREYGQELMASGLLDSFEEIEQTEKLGSWPGQAAIVSLANIFGVNIAIVQGGDKGDIDIQHISPFEEESENEQGSVILAYLYNGHYDAVVDTPDLPNPDFDNWLLQAQKAHNEGTLGAHSPVAQDPYYSYVLHNGYDTLKLRKQERETLAAYEGSSAPASSAAPPHTHSTPDQPLVHTPSLDEEPQRFETDHSLETIRSPFDRPTVDLQDFFVPDEESYDSNTGLPTNTRNILNETERESGIINKLDYREDDVIVNDSESVQDSLINSPVPMDDIDSDGHDHLPRDMFVSSSASSLATESEMSIHLDDDMDTASTTSHFDSDTESRFTQASEHPYPEKSSILFDDVFDHGNEETDCGDFVPMDYNYTKSLDRRWLRNRKEQALSPPVGVGEIEEPKSRIVFKPRPKIHRSTSKEGTPYQRPMPPEKKEDGWGINTSELLQAAGLTKARPGEIMAQVSQKYGPVHLEEPDILKNAEQTSSVNKDTGGSNTGTLRSERFLAKRKKEGRKFPLLKTDDAANADIGKENVLSPTADIPSSSNLISNLEGLREWRLRYGPSSKKTPESTAKPHNAGALHDSANYENIRESPDILMRRSESREQSVDSVIYVPTQAAKDGQDKVADSRLHESAMRDMQDTAHSEEMTVAGGHSLSNSHMSASGKHADNAYAPGSPLTDRSHSYVNDNVTDQGTYGRISRPQHAFRSSDLHDSVLSRSSASSPSSEAGDTNTGRGFTRRKQGYQHPRLARSRSREKVLDSPDRDGYDSSDSMRGAATNVQMSDSEPSYDTLKGSARSQALLKSRMRTGRSQTRDQPDSGPSSLPLPPRSHTPPQPAQAKTHSPPQPAGQAGAQSYSRPAYSSQPSSSSYHSSSHTEGKGLSNEELVNARRFSLESSQRVEDCLVKDPSQVLPASLLAEIDKMKTPKDKPKFESTRRFKKAEEDYVKTHLYDAQSESESRVENESNSGMHVPGASQENVQSVPQSGLTIGGNQSAKTIGRYYNVQRNIGANDVKHVSEGNVQGDTAVQNDVVYKELSESERSVAAAYSTKSSSADVMSGMSALSGITLSSGAPPRAPPRFVRQLSSPSMQRKVLSPPQQQTVKQQLVQQHYQPMQQQQQPLKQQQPVQQQPAQQQPAPERQELPPAQPSVPPAQPLVPPAQPHMPPVQPYMPPTQPTMPPAPKPEVHKPVNVEAIHQTHEVQVKQPLQQSNTQPVDKVETVKPLVQQEPVVEQSITQHVQQQETMKPHVEEYAARQVSEEPLQTVVQPLKLEEQTDWKPVSEYKEASPSRFIQQPSKDSELLKSKLFQQQQQKLHENEVEESTPEPAAEPASIRRHEIHRQLSNSDQVKAPRMRVLPLQFVGRKGNTFTKQLSLEEEQALLSRRAKREEYERQNSNDSRSSRSGSQVQEVPTMRHVSDTRESSNESFKSASEEPLSHSPRRFHSVEHILVADADNGNLTPETPVALSPIISLAGAAQNSGIQITVSNEGNKSPNIRERVILDTPPILMGEETLFEKVRLGATHKEVESEISRQRNSSVSSQRSTEEKVSEGAEQPVYDYQSPPNTPSYASSVCSSTGLREVEEIHCQHPSHQHHHSHRPVKARATLPPSLLFPGRVSSSRTSSTGSATSSPYITPPASGRTSPSRSDLNRESFIRGRPIPVQLTNEARRSNIGRSTSYWDEPGNDFESKVDSMFNQHLDRERRGSVPITIQHVKRQPADGASLPHQVNEKVQGQGSQAGRSNSVPNAAQPSGSGSSEESDRPPAGIVKDRLREWVEGQRQHQGNWDSQSQQSEAASQHTRSDATHMDESASMLSDDASRAESATPTPSDASFTYADRDRRGLQRNVHIPVQHVGGHRVHREFVEEHGTSDGAGTAWHRTFSTESGYSDRDHGPSWSARVDFPNRMDFGRTGRSERFMRLRDRPFFLETDRSFGFPSLLRPLGHRLRDDIKSAFDDDWFYRH